MGLAGCDCCGCCGGLRRLRLMEDGCCCSLDEEEVLEIEDDEGPKGMPGRPLFKSESDCTAPHQSWERSSFSSINGVGY